MSRRLLQYNSYGGGSNVTSCRACLAVAAAGLRSRNIPSAARSVSTTVSAEAAIWRENGDRDDLGEGTSTQTQQPSLTQFSSDQPSARRKISPGSSGFERRKNFFDKWRAWTQPAADSGSSAAPSATVSTFSQQKPVNEDVRRPLTARTSRLPAIRAPIFASASKTEHLTVSSPDVMPKQDVSGIEASTSSLSLDALEDYISRGIFPVTPGRARSLALAARQRDRRSLSSILDSARASTVRRGGHPEAVEIEFAILGPILSANISHDHRPLRRHLRSARRTKGKHASAWPNLVMSSLSQFTGTTASPYYMDKQVYMQAWARAWELQGDGLTLEPGFAAHVLENLLQLSEEELLGAPVSEHSTENGSHTAKAIPFAYTVSALRHLLFQAGLAEHPDLALDLLTRTLVRDSLVPPHRSGAPSPATLRPPESTDLTQDVPLVLHDLLRAGIIPSSTLRDYDLSTILRWVMPGVSLAGVFEEQSGKKQKNVSDVNALLQQCLLRVVARSYSLLGNVERATSCVSLLEPLPDGILKPSALHTLRQKDPVLLKQICRRALQSSEVTGIWINRVAQIMTASLLGMHPLGNMFKQDDSAVGRDEGEDSRMQWAAGDEVRLLQQFFDTALPSSALLSGASNRSRLRVASAALVFKALHHTGGLSHFSPNLDQLIRILSFCSHPLSTENAARFARFFPSRAYDETQSSLERAHGSGGASDPRHLDFVKAMRFIRERVYLAPRDCNSEQINFILRVLLSTPATTDRRLEEARRRVILHLYSFVTSPMVRLADTFSLEADNLVPLIRLTSMTASNRSSSNISSTINGNVESGDSATVVPHALLAGFLDGRPNRHYELDARDFVEVARALYELRETASARSHIDGLIRNRYLFKLTSRTIQNLLEDLLSFDPRQCARAVEALAAQDAKIPRTSIELLLESEKLQDSHKDRIRKSAASLHRPKSRFGHTAVQHASTKAIVQMEGLRATKSASDLHLAGGVELASKVSNALRPEVTQTASTTTDAKSVAGIRSVKRAVPQPVRLPSFRAAAARLDPSAQLEPHDHVSA